ncbi:TPA: head processing protein [Enterobacter hormaechei subsp. xiangfangensis]|nr:head processing protein [Enterobacter hormaechei subsp. xiangfangensis]
MSKGLRTVTDRFSLVDLYRQHTYQNNRQYLIQAVQATFESAETKERIRLGEAFGYYGHGRREMHFNKTGSLRVPETSVIMVEGAPVIVDNVPSNRTLDIRVDSEGIVTHTQEILDTPTGQIVDGMERSQAGGWSWATKGGQAGGQAIIREYAGMDFVTTPNFISLDRVMAMNESAEDEEAGVIRALMASGMTQNAAVDVYQHFKRMREGTSLFESATRASAAELELFVMQGQLSDLSSELSSHKEQLTAMMESAKNNRSERRKAVRGLLERLPFHVTDEQRRALINMETGHDVEVVMGLFESVASSSVADLPIGKNYQPAPVAASKDYSDDPAILELVDRRKENRYKR